MADVIDIANDLIDSEVSRALNELRQKKANQNEKGSKWCVECGETIPEGRRKLGYELCVPCAQDAERKDALFAG